MECQVRQEMPNHEGPQGPAVRPNREPGAQAAPAQGGPRAGHGPRGPDDDPELHRQRIAQAAGGVLRDAAGRLLAGSHLNSPGRTGAESWEDRLQALFWSIAVSVAHPPLIRDRERGPFASSFRISL